MKKPDVDISQAILITDNFIALIDPICQGEASIKTMEYARDWLRDEAFYYPRSLKGKMLNAFANLIDEEINND